MIEIVTIVYLVTLNVLLLMLQHRRHRKIVDALRSRYDSRYCCILEMNVQLCWKIHRMEQEGIKCPQRFLSIEEIQNKRVEQANEQKT